MSEQKDVVCLGCGRKANWYDPDDFDSLGSVSGICCITCGKEEFLTIGELWERYAAEQKEKEKLNGQLLVILKVTKSRLIQKSMSTYEIDSALQALGGKGGQE